MNFSVRYIVAGIEKRVDFPNITVDILADFVRELLLSDIAVVVINKN